MPSISMRKWSRCHSPKIPSKRSGRKGLPFLITTQTFGEKTIVELGLAEIFMGIETPNTGGRLTISNQKTKGAVMTFPISAHCNGKTMQASRLDALTV